MNSCFTPACHHFIVLQEMKDAEYAVRRSDKINRGLSAAVLIIVLGIEIGSGIYVFWYRFAAAPVLATAMIWFSDPIGCSLPWRTAPRDVRLLGWAALLVMAAIALISRDS
jgi:hypothetical protein